MHDAGMAFALDSFDKTQRRQRIDEAGRAILRVRPVGQFHAHLHWQSAILRIHCSAQQSDCLAHQGLGSRTAAGRDNNTTAFIADGHCFPQPTGHGAQTGGGHVSRHSRMAVHARLSRRRHVRRPNQQAKIRRINRGRQNLHQHLIFARLIHSCFIKIDVQLPFRLDQSPDQKGFFGRIGHATLLFR